MGKYTDLSPAIADYLSASDSFNSDKGVGVQRGAEISRRKNLSTNGEVTQPLS